MHEQGLHRSANPTLQNLAKPKLSALSPTPSALQCQTLYPGASPETLSHKAETLDPEALNPRLLLREGSWVWDSLRSDLLLSRQTAPT